MKSLESQFVTAMNGVYGVEENCETALKDLNNDKKEFVVLQDLLFRYNNKPELVKAVKERIATKGFFLGMNARKFMLECADEIFREKLKTDKKLPNEDIVSRMKRLHPLWGDILME